MQKQPIFYDHICKKYGKVFLSLDHDIRADLGLFLHWARSHPVAISLLNQSSLPQGLAKRILDLFFQSHPVHVRSKGALHTLRAHHRLSYTSAIVSYMTVKKDHIVDAFLRSAQTLSEKAIQRIAHALESATQRKPRIHSTINPDLFMGTVLVWDCSMIDASLKKLVQSICQEDFRE